MTDLVREFAQGLLLEAMDASYALGWVKVIIGAFEGIFVREPTAALKKIVRKLAIKGAKHWFKRIKFGADLSHIQIYELVRIQINSHFSTKMNAYLTDIPWAKNKSGTAHALIDYAATKSQQKIVWVC